jgi:uncharacterized YigZ family protein
LEIEDSYLTLKKTSEGLYKEKGSKFLAFAYPVDTEEQIKDILDSLRKKYYDARHHCYAYMLGKNQDVYRANDDGEPNHSAGDPILGQIRSHQLTNVLIVVIRYFGGTKLGVGGLISAYKTAAAEAIQNNEIITAIVHSRLGVDFDYLAMNDVMKIIKDFDLQLVNQQFDNICRLEIQVREKFKAMVIEKFEDIHGVNTINEIS